MSAEANLAGLLAEKPLRESVSSTFFCLSPDFSSFDIFTLSSSSFLPPPVLCSFPPHCFHFFLLPPIVPPQRLLFLLLPSFLTWWWDENVASETPPVENHWHTSSYFLRTSALLCCNPPTSSSLHLSLLHLYLQASISVSIHFAVVQVCSLHRATRSLRPTWRGSPSPCTRCRPTKTRSFFPTFLVKLCRRYDSVWLCILFLPAAPPLSPERLCSLRAADEGDGTNARISQHHQKIPGSIPPPPTVGIFKSSWWTRTLLMKLRGDEFALCSSSLWSGPHGAGEQQDRVEQHGRAIHLERVRHAILRGERTKVKIVSHFSF